MSEDEIKTRLKVYQATAIFSVLFALVGLIADLSHSCGDTVRQAASELRSTWSANWQQLSTERQAADAVVAGIDITRGEVQGVLSLLD